MSRQILHIDTWFSHRSTWIKIFLQIPRCSDTVRWLLLPTDESVESLWCLPLRRFTRATATDNDALHQQYCHADSTRAAFVTSQVNDCGRQGHKIRCLPVFRTMQAVVTSSTPYSRKFAMATLIEEKQLPIILQQHWFDLPACQDLQGLFDSFWLMQQWRLCVQI